MRWIPLHVDVPQVTTDFEVCPAGTMKRLEDTESQILTLLEKIETLTEAIVACCGGEA